MRFRQQACIVTGPEPTAADLRRMINRRRMREFLRATPRAEPESQLELLGPDEGLPPRYVTRAALTAAIDGMRPRMHQILRLTMEERYTREQTQEYLHGISERTLERDQAAGLDLLINLAK